jgi:hypothetical protein
MAFNPPFTTDFLHGSHVSRVRVTMNGADLPITGGNLTVDAGQTIRRSATLRTPYSDELWTLLAGYPIYPVVIYGGYEYPNGLEYETVIARLYVTGAGYIQPDDTITISATDGMARLLDQPFTTAGTSGNVAPMITTLIQQAIPAATVTNLAPTVSAVGIDWWVADSRDRVIGDLASIADAMVYAHHETPDLFIIEPVPFNPAPLTPDYTFTSGDNVTIVQAEWSREDFANALTVVHTWTDPNSDKSVRRSSTAYHTDPASPSRWGGPAGKANRVWARDTVISQTQLDVQCRTWLKRRIGAGSGTTLTTWPHWWLDVWDVIDIDTDLTPTRREFIETIAYDLAEMQMTIQTRRPDATTQPSLLEA